MNICTDRRPDRKPMRRTLTALCASTLLLIGAPALAQQPQAQPQGQAPTTQQAPVQVSDDQVKTFAKAQERVVEIGRKWNSQMQQQEQATPEQINKVRESAHQEMVIAVEAIGMSVDDYNRIAIAMQTDPSLQQRVRAAQSGG